jgi:hypothetical protein
MKNIDVVARAEMSRLKVEIHRLKTALRMSVNALDVAFKSTERVIECLSRPPHQIKAPQGKEEIEAVRRARGEILNMRNLLR